MNQEKLLEKLKEIFISKGIPIEVKGMTKEEIIKTLAELEDKE